MKNKDYNLKISVRNNKLLKLMGLKGIGSAAQLSRALGGYSQQAIGEAINLKRPAYRSNGTPKHLTLALCDYFNVLPEDLFPEENLYNQLDSNTSETEISFDQMVSIGQNDSSLISEPSYEQGALPMYRAIDAMLDELPERESKIIRHRFGIDGHEEKTLGELGVIFGVDKERIRQIEAKALRKMRHPTRNKGVADALANPQ